MLLQFWCSNFASIRDRAILSLVPSADKKHQENIVRKGKYSALNEIAIYGANASGKSNLFKALTLAVNIIRQSSLRQVNVMIPVIPFKLDDTSRGKPSSFEFTFVASDGRKYIYGFSADTLKVHEEYLYRCSSSRRFMIFERTEEKYEYAKSLKEQLESVQKRNTPNKLFLATATNWNVEPTSIPYRWLSEGIDTFTNDGNIPGLTLDLYRQHGDEYTDFTRDLLKQADINIDDINVEAEKVSGANGQFVPGLLVNGMLLQPAEQYRIKITTGHVIKDGEREGKSYPLSLEEESLGTRQLFYFAPLIKQALDSGKTLFIDELDRSMHPSLVKFLVDMFRRSEKNPHGAQLIFTTHETTLLSRRTFRTDQIYFMEKNSENAVSVLYSLDEFELSKKENLEKGYLLGRYGAIPFLQTEELI